MLNVKNYNNLLLKQQLTSFFAAKFISSYLQQQNLPQFLSQRVRAKGKAENVIRGQIFKKIRVSYAMSTEFRLFNIVKITAAIKPTDVMAVSTQVEIFHATLHVSDD